MKRLTRILVGLVLSLFLVVPAFAIPIIDFRDGDATGGVVTVSGGNVIGTNIALDSLNVTGTATKDGTYDLGGAIAAPSDSDDFTAAALNFNTATGVITIVGGVRTIVPPGQVIPNGTTLLTGTITGFTILQETGTTLFMQAVGFDTKDLGLLRYLGIDPTGFVFTSFEIGANANGTGSPYIADSTDVNNQGSGVPEPISLILLGSGLAGAGLYRRLRKPKD